MRYLRLWRCFILLAILRAMEYRFNFLISLMEGLGQLVLAVLTLELLYRFTDEVAGWSQPQVLLLLGIYRTVDALINLQVAPNMQAISGYIRRGEMDFLLLRPVPNQFLVSLRLLSPPEAGNVLIGLGLTVWAGNRIDVAWHAAGLAAALAFAACGLILLYCLRFFIVTFSFWLVQVDTLDMLFYSAFETARYPVSFFKGIVRTLLTFAFPVAFATTFPTQALLGEIDLRLLMVGVVMAGGSLRISGI